MKNPNVIISLTKEKNFRSCPSLKKFSEWVRAVFSHLQIKDPYEINIHLLSKPSAKTINFAYRKKNYATNVLSFRYPRASKKQAIIAELVFCPEVLAEEAKQEKKPLTAHWAQLTVHGSLHILGYDHENEAEAWEMEKLEDAVLACLFG